MAKGGESLDPVRTVPAGHAFRRELRLFDATMIVVGSMIGSGIFIVSADIVRTVGSPGWLLVVWLLTGFVTLVGALSYGELAGMMPAAGGQYVYLREAYGPLVGFLYGWTLFLVIQTGTIAAVGVAFAKFTAVLFPALGTKNIVFTVGERGISAAQLLAIASIAALTLVNLFGLRAGKRVQNAFTVSKTVALGTVIVLGVLLGANAGVVRQNLATAWNAATLTAGPEGLGAVPLGGIALLAAVGAAMVGSLFSSDAWNNITFAAAEVDDPRRTIPLALALGTGTVTVLYLLANLAYLAVLPAAGDPAAAEPLARGIAFATDDRVGTALAQVVFGASGAAIMAVLILVSTFGCNNGLILAGARVSYAMAHDGLFFSGAGRLNRYGVPGVALIVQGAWASALCLSGTYGDLLDYVVFAVLVFYILTVGGIFILRRTRPDAERPYRALGYPFVPALYILLAAAIAIDLLIVKPRFTWPGVFIVLAGIPAYAVWRAVGRRRSNRPDQRRGAG